MAAIFQKDRSGPDLVTESGLPCAILIGVAALQPMLVLVGWSLEIPVLRGNGDPDYAFAPLTAVLFLLVLVGAVPAMRNRIRLSRRLLILPSVLIFLILCRYAFGLDVGLERLLFPQQVQTLEVGNSGLTGFGAALMLCTLLLSIYMLGASNPAWRTGAVLAASAAISLALLTTSVVLIDPPKAVSQRFIGTSLYSSIPLFALGTAIILHAFRDQRGLEGRPTWRLLRRIAPALVIFPAIASVLSFATYRNGLLGYTEAQFIVLAGNVTIVSLLLFYTLKQLSLQHRALYRRERQLRAVLAAVPDAVIVIDRGGMIIDFSPAAERLWNYTAEAAVGRAVTMLAPERDHASHKRVLSACGDDVGENDLRTATAIGRRYDGSEFPLELRFGSARGDLDFIPIFARDLTHQLASEDHLAELNIELAHLARQVAMGEIAADLAHELNQPLAAASNYLAAISMQNSAIATDGESAHMLGEATRQIHRAGDIIRRVRAFTLRKEVDRRTEQLRPLFEEAGRLLLVGSGRFDVQIEFDIQPPDLTAFVDRIQIQQVVVNLVRNAAEAVRSSSGGEARVAISARPVGDTSVVVEIRDNGPGLSPAVQKHLFERFSTTKHEASGTGLGLSISKRIIEAHEGRITAGNNPEGGAFFRFTLPRLP
ncbi:sensor histidine kinase [Sphingosinithalassobacter sp. LHW66-3]|uniref:sensor histidine kinase n=1 Tax=Sphingosinithalassobacter sp. LHW66-3 TaxID=3424718 RepID=UPI003D6B100F